MFFWAHAVGTATASSTVVSTQRTSAITNRTPSPQLGTAPESIRKRAPHDQRIGRADHLMVLVVVIELTEHVAHRVDAGTLLVVALHHGPGRHLGVCPGEHLLFGRGVVLPLV